MPFVNTAGLTLIGAGSEWFWTAVSGIVLAVTFIAIYRQLRLARSESAIAQIDAFTREWNSERLLMHRRELLIALRDVKDPADLPEGAAARIGNYWEGIAALTRAGHLDERLLWRQYGSSCQVSWSILAAYARVGRIRDQDPTLFEDFEWLVGTLDDLDHRAGGSPPPEMTEESRERAIERINGMLAVERALREVPTARLARRGTSQTGPA